VAPLGGLSGGGAGSASALLPSLPDGTGGGYVALAGGGYGGLPGGGYAASAAGATGGGYAPLGGATGGRALVSLLLAAEQAGPSSGPGALRNSSFMALRSIVASLQSCFGVLDPLERRALVLRFGLGGALPLSSSAIGRTLGMSPSAVQRLELGALAQLDGASRAGCGGAGDPAYVLFPATVGTLLTAALGASGSAAGPLGQPARTASFGTPADVWPSAAHAGALRIVLMVLAVVGGLLLLAGLVLRRRELVEPALAPVANGRHGENTGRSAGVFRVRRGAHATSNGATSNGKRFPSPAARERRPRAGARER
jgi:hypothetical protein